MLMAAITLHELRPLLDQFTGDGLVLSCYADLGVTEGVRPDWWGVLRARADAIQKALGDDGQARPEFEQNLSVVRDALSAPELHGIRWAAAFSATRRGFLRVVPLDVPVGTDLVVDRSPYLVPLLEGAHRRREYLAVHTDTHRARIYAATPGDARLLDEIDEEVPPRQHSEGERWGYGQATITRRREDHILHYRKELIGELTRLWDAGQYAGVILLGAHVVIEHIREDLPPRLADRVVREAAEPWYERPEHAEESAREAAADLYAQEDVGVAPDFWDRLREGRAIAMGPRAVLDALQGGRLGPDGSGYLVLGPDRRETVGRCLACRSLSLDSLGQCPKCLAPCAPGSLWEELLLTALRHRISARFVKDPRRLAPYGGVVAALPRVRGSRR
jgi:hypothetical protein